MSGGQFYLIAFGLGLNFFSVAAVLLLIFFFLQKNKTAKDDTNTPAIGFLNQAQEKTEAILNKTIKQANRILAEAELKGIGLMAREKLTGEKITQEYRKHLTNLEETLQEKFAQSMKESEETFREFMGNIEKTVTENASVSQKTLEDKAAAFIDGSQQAVNTLVTDVHNKVNEQVEKELAAAKQAIEEYKTRRMKIIDENIVEILEKTLRVALGKKMSLADQSELIYKALEEAKNEHALT